jgi:monovalent cation/hydrogen antiporter
VGLDLVIAVVGGVVLGLVAGELTRRALAALHDAAAETTVTVAVPFGTYLLADHDGASGVLAVLVLGLYLRSYGHSAVTSGGWLLGRAVWRYADYLITSLVFVLIGFELTAVLEESNFGGDTVLLTATVVGTIVVFRILWVFPAAALVRVWHRRRDTASPVGFGETAVVSWAGMRGVVTVATALALPTALENGDAFPERGVIVIVGLVCVLSTLVVQGLTLAPLVRLLGVGSEANTQAEIAELRHRAAEAALQVVRDLAQDPRFEEPVARAAVMQYEGYLSAQSALSSAGGTGSEEGYQQQLAELLTTASGVEREVVLQARRSGEFSVGATDEVLQEVEARALRDFPGPG